MSVKGKKTRRAWFGFEFATSGRFKGRQYERIGRRWRRKRRRRQWLRNTGGPESAKQQDHSMRPGQIFCVFASSSVFFIFAKPPWQIFFLSVSQENRASGCMQLQFSKCQRNGGHRVSQIERCRCWPPWQFPEPDRSICSAQQQYTVVGVRSRKRMARGISYQRFLNQS